MVVLARIFSNLRMRSKLLLIAASFLVGLLAVSSLSIYYIALQNRDWYNDMRASQRRMVTMSQMRETIGSLFEVAAALAGTIARDDPKEVRENAVNAIRSFSNLDEGIHRLRSQVAIAEEDPQIVELTHKIETLRAEILTVISAARDNQDNDALLKAQKVIEGSLKFYQASSVLADGERQNILNEVVKKTKAGESVARLLAFISVVTVLFGAFFGFMTSRAIVSSVGKLRQSLLGLAQGDLATPLPEPTGDEIGSMTISLSHAVNCWRDAVKRIIYSSQLSSENAETIRATLVATNDISRRLHEAIEQIRNEAQDMKERAAHVFEDLGRVTVMAKSTSVAVASTERNIDTTLTSYQGFQATLRESVGTLQDLARYANEIAPMAKTISGISAQTNLLALNAAIEAARAGEHGRGFAVVADEVRSLAARADDAARKISEVIERIVQTSAVSVASNERAVQEAASSDGRLREARVATQQATTQSAEADRIMQQTSELVTNQTSSVEHVAQLVDNLLTISSDVRRQSGSLDTMAHSLADASKDLAQATGGFKV